MKHTHEELRALCDACGGHGKIEVEPDSLEFHPCDTCRPEDFCLWKESNERFELSRAAFRELWDQIPKSRQTDFDNIFRSQNVMGFLDQLRREKSDSISATDPPTVRALLDEIERLKCERGIETRLTLGERKKIIGDIFKDGWTVQDLSRCEAFYNSVQRHLRERKNDE